MYSIFPHFSLLPSFSVCFYFVSLTFPPLSPSRSLVIHFVIFYKNEKNIFSSPSLSSFSSRRRSLTLVCDLSLLSLFLASLTSEWRHEITFARTCACVCVRERCLTEKWEICFCFYWIDGTHPTKNLKIFVLSHFEKIYAARSRGFVFFFFFSRINLEACL